MANNFTIDKQEYLFKLIPDLSVFDVVERYFIDNDKPRGINGLFFYSDNVGSTIEIDETETTRLSISDIKFRRFIVKSNGTISTTPESEETSNFINHSFFINENGMRINYLIIIDEQNKVDNFTVTRTGGDYIIGVCF